MSTRINEGTPRQAQSPPPAQAFPGLRGRQTPAPTLASAAPTPGLPPSPPAPAPLFSAAAQTRWSTTLSWEPSTRTSSSRIQKRPLASSAPPPAGRRTWRETQDTLRSPDPLTEARPGLLVPPRESGVCGPASRLRRAGLDPRSRSPPDSQWRSHRTTILSVTKVWILPLSSPPG